MKEFREILERGSESESSDDSDDEASSDEENSDEDAEEEEGKQHNVYIIRRWQFQSNTDHGISFLFLFFLDMDEGDESESDNEAVEEDWFFFHEKFPCKPFKRHSLNHNSIINQIVTIYYQLVVVNDTTGRQPQGTQLNIVFLN